MYEEIHEPIDVIAYFHNGNLRPLRFRWKGRAYKAKTVNAHWCQSGGVMRNHHYSVTVASSDSYELQFVTDSFRWNLVRVCFVG